MAFKHPVNGAGSVPSYQLSGVPYVTASAANEVPANNGIPVKHEFPYVTRFFQIENTDSSEVLRVGLTSNGVKGTVTKNYFTLGTNTKSEVLELRVKDLFFLSDHNSNPASFAITAGLTPIDRKHFPTLTGSDGYVGVG